LLRISDGGGRAGSRGWRIASGWLVTKGVRKKIDRQIIYVFLPPSYVFTALVWLRYVVIQTGALICLLQVEWGVHHTQAICGRNWKSQWSILSLSWIQFGVRESCCNWHLQLSVNQLCTLQGHNKLRKCFHPNLFQNTAVEAEYRTDWRRHNSLDFYPTGTWFVSLRAVLIDNFVFPESLQSKGLLASEYEFIFRIVFWDVLPCKNIVDPDDGGSTYLWNVGRQSFYTAVHHGRQFWTPYSPPWELEISHQFICLMPRNCLSKHFTWLDFCKKKVKWKMASFH
jgi:hypothetical protein